MRNKTNYLFIVLSLVMLWTISCSIQAQNPSNRVDQYEPSWPSLKQHQTPQWLRDGKFGIYTHWGVYSVPAHHLGGNGTWYSHGIYNAASDPENDEMQEALRYHEENYGPLNKFGYKDYVPLFTAEKFDAGEWAELFKKSGARFAGPVAEHHDGFAMWDSKYSDWNAARMGPKRDIVGELEVAVKKEGMKFVTAFHHAANWFFFPVWDERYDCSNPEYSGLYGLNYNGGPPSKEFLDEWHGKIIEVIDNYSPDFIWFDFGLDLIREDYVKDFVAYYYNKSLEWGRDVVITYKEHDLPPGVALRDLELGQASKLTYHEWITDSSVDEDGAWSYVHGITYKPVDRLVDMVTEVRGTRHNIAWQDC